MHGRTMTNLDLVKAAVSVADLIFNNDLVRIMGEDPFDDRFSVESRRSECVNYYYGQTKSGLFLKYYYGAPSTILTPWGGWGFAGGSSGEWPEEMQRLLEDKLGLELHIAKHNTEYGVFGPLYKIKRVNDLVLPEPVLYYDEIESIFEVVHRTRTQAEYEALTAEWEQLFSQVTGR